MIHNLFFVRISDNAQLGLLDKKSLMKFVKLVTGHLQNNVNTWMSLPNVATANFNVATEAFLEIPFLEENSIYLHMLCRDLTNVETAKPL